VGQPRDGNPLSSYGLYDTETNEYRLIRVEYNIALAQQKILAAGLPRFLLNGFRRILIQLIRRERPSAMSSGPNGKGAEIIKSFVGFIGLLVLFANYW